MRRESHVRFCERVGVRFPRPTRHVLFARDEDLEAISKYAPLNLFGQQDVA